jgi:hypothetical protein
MTRSANESPGPGSLATVAVGVVTALLNVAPPVFFWFNADDTSEDDIRWFISLAAAVCLSLAVSVALMLGPSRRRLGRAVLVGLVLGLAVDAFLLVSFAMAVGS